MAERPASTAVAPDDWVDIPYNIPQSHNNPGNLTDAAGNIRVFNNVDEGRAALLDDLKAKVGGKNKHGLGPNSTLSDLSEVWAPRAAGNKPEDWANNVASTIGAKPETPIGRLPVLDIAKGIEHAEGFHATGPAQGSAASEWQDVDPSTVMITHGGAAQKPPPGILQRMVDAVKQWLPNGPAPDWPEFGPKFRKQIEDVAGMAAAELPRIGGELESAVGSAMKGNVGEAAYHAAGAVPLIGPAAQQVGREAGEGKNVEALTHAGMLLAPEALKAAGPVAEAAGAAGRAATEVDIPALRAKTWSIHPTEPDVFEAGEPQAYAAIKNAAGGTVGQNRDVLGAAKVAESEAAGAFNRWMDDARRYKRTVDGNPIVQATKDAIPETMDPATASNTIKDAQRLFSQPMSVDRAYKIMREMNADLDAFYDKSTGKQIATEVAGKPQAIIKAQLNALRNKLYETLDPENEGAGPREVQQRRGAIITIRDAAEKADPSALKQAPVTTLQGLTKAGAAIADIPGKILHGDVESIQNPATAYKGTINANVKRLFEQAPEFEDYPLPGRPPRLLGTTDTSAVRAVPAQVGQQPQLTGPSRVIITPPPADTSSVQAVPAGGASAIPNVRGLLETGAPPQPTLKTPASSTVMGRQGPLRTPFVDTSGVEVPSARSIIVRDPKTGRWKKLYTSEAK